MGKKKGSATNRNPDVQDVRGPTLSVTAVLALPTIQSCELGSGRNKHILKTGDCIYSLPEGEPIVSKKRHDGHKLKVKALISLHRGPNRIWALCRDLLHKSDAALTDEVVGNKRPFFGIGELVATRQRSVVDAGRIVSPVDVHMFDVLAADVPEIPANGWWVRYLLDGRSLRGLAGTLANPDVAPNDPPGLACCDKPYCPNVVKGQCIYCTSCKLWYHISCKYRPDGGENDSDDEDDGPGRWKARDGRNDYLPGTLIDNLRKSPIVRGAFYRVGNDPECYREDWMLGGSGHYILNFRQLCARGDLGDNPTARDVREAFGNDQLLCDLEELDFPEVACPGCGESL